MKTNNFKSLIQYLPGVLILIYVFFLSVDITYVIVHIF